MLSHSDSHFSIKNQASQSKFTRFHRNSPFFQSIPQFLPVVRGAINSPVSNDADITKRLHEDHMKNMCNRMEEHLNKTANEVANHQAILTAKIKEVKSNQFAY